MKQILTFLIASLTAFGVSFTQPDTKQMVTESVTITQQDTPTGKTTEVKKPVVEIKPSVTVNGIDKGKVIDYAVQIITGVLAAVLLNFLRTRAPDYFTKKNHRGSKNGDEINT